MILASPLGRGPRGGGFRHRGGGGFRRRPVGFWPSGYVYPELLPYAVAPVCATHPAPPPPCTGTLVWRDQNTVCCLP